LVGGPGEGFTEVRYQGLGMGRLEHRSFKPARTPAIRFGNQMRATVKIATDQVDERTFSGAPNWTG
jgi:hypothetical protein